MKDAIYENPQSPMTGKHASFLIVITFFDSGKKNYWNHFVDDKKETIALNLKAHHHFDPGVENWEIMIIDHGGFPKELLKQYPDIDYIDTENFGYGFGGWKQAYEDHGGEAWNYYCFCEDDIAPTKDGWLLEILNKFQSSGDIGAVGNIVEARSRNENGSALAWEALGNPDREMIYNFDGGYTFTSSMVLHQLQYAKEISEDPNSGWKNKGLHVVDCGPDSKYPPTVNEIIFQQGIMEMGYRIVSFADGEHFLVHGSEILSNDVMYRTGPPAPLLNLNGRHKVPEIAEIFKPIL